MRVLLINKNPVVSRIMKMSVPKAGFDIEECESVYNLPHGSYDVVIIDDDMYDENFLHDIKQHIQYKQIGLITTTRNELSEKFDFILTKPFLPTDLIEILRGLHNKIRAMTSHTNASYEEAKQISEPQQESSETQMLEPAQQEEKIVEIEESEEESPFVETIDEPGNVLDKEEIQKVNALLEETDEESVTDNKEEPTLSDEYKQQTQSSSQTAQKKVMPTSLMAHEANGETDEPTQEQAPQSAEPSKRVENTQELQSNKQHAPSSLQGIHLQQMTQHLSSQDIRNILDGMQLEIVIKISYPKSDDV